MILPFVRELMADLEHSDAFELVRRHLAGGTGRRRVSGLTATVRALYVRYFGRAAQSAQGAAASVPILVSDNKAAGALDADEELRLPAHDVLPFENLSSHSEIPEQRASALWKLDSGSAKLVIAPFEAACIRLISRDYYAALAPRLCVGEEDLPDMLVEYLLSVGYTRVDVVEMPGQVSMRGGILDVYGPEMERPVRVDFIGDEIESMRRFDSETQRSSSAVDELLLVPLTETPATEALLSAINARLTRRGTVGAELEGGDLDINR